MTISLNHITSERLSDRKHFPHHVTSVKLSDGGMFRREIAFQLKPRKQVPSPAPTSLTSKPGKGEYLPQVGDDR